MRRGSTLQARVGSSGLKSRGDLKHSQVAEQIGRDPALATHALAAIPRAFESRL
jgi:hypothetical protein